MIFYKVKYTGEDNPGPIEEINLKNKRDFCTELNFGGVWEYVEHDIVYEYFMTLEDAEEQVKKLQQGETVREDVVPYNAAIHRALNT
jgi:hypothetical protein